MKKLALIAGAILLIGLAAYVAYEVYLPAMIAQSITDEPVAFVPDNIQHRLDKIRKPVNEGADAVVQTMYKSGVSMDQILKAIDNAEEEQAYAFLNELNKADIQSADQVFSIAKKYFPVDFDVEIFRKPFNEKVTLATIKKGVRYANIYKDKEEFDVSTAKSIMKRILLQKEDEFKRLTEYRD
jgi:hypothetical protein